MGQYGSRRGPIQGFAPPPPSFTRLNSKHLATTMHGLAKAPSSGLHYWVVLREHWDKTCLKSAFTMREGKQEKKRKDIPLN